jgi:hypothetical protein
LDVPVKQATHLDVRDARAAIANLPVLNARHIRIAVGWDGWRVGLWRGAKLTPALGRRGWWWWTRGCSSTWVGSGTTGRGSCDSTARVGAHEVQEHRPGEGVLVAYLSRCAVAILGPPFARARIREAINGTSTRVRRGRGRGVEDRGHHGINGVVNLLKLVAYFRGGGRTRSAIVVDNTARSFRPGRCEACSSTEEEEACFGGHHWSRSIGESS